jgi:hypothetical protein
MKKHRAMRKIVRRVMVYFDMEYMYDSSVPEGMLFLVVRKDNDVGARSGINRVLCASHVIGRVIDSTNLVRVKFIVKDLDLIELSRRQF